MSHALLLFAAVVIAVVLVAVAVLSNSPAVR